MLNPNYVLNTVSTDAANARYGGLKLEYTLKPNSVIHFTFPLYIPATNESPIFNVPFCTNTVAIGPFPLSSFNLVISNMIFFIYSIYGSRLNKLFS